MIDNSLEKLTQKFLKLNSPQEIEDVDNSYHDLIDVLVYHNNLYYIYSNPTISDYQYDQLFDLLKKIEETNPQIISPNSPTQRLVGQIQDSFKTAEHETPMLSLENSYNAQDLLDKDEFIAKRVEEKYTYSLEPKFDGSSVELVYENGKLSKAITRGDGYTGEDITENVKMIDTVPLYLKNFENISKLIVRGEIVMPKSVFNKLNQEKEKKGESSFANPRNAATGTLRQLDPQIVANRKLVCFIYDCVYQSSDFNSFAETESELKEALKSFGFAVYDWHKVCENIQEVIDICQDPQTQEYFENQNIEFDGIVVKINERKFHEKLGATNHHPRWAIAYKFPAKQIATKIIDVELNVSRTSSINPVAILETVNLSGVNISRATLHNWDFINEKDIRIGDWVWIQRSGEVIPYILSVIKEKRTGEEKQIYPPTVCPVCDSKVMKVEGDVNYYCSNINCPSVIKEKIIHFVSKDCMDIDGLGSKFIETLVDTGIIKHYADLYSLKNKKSYLKSLPLMGDKRVDDMLFQIENSKNPPLWRLINALGIKFVGKKTAKILVENLETISPGASLESETAPGLVIKYLTDEEFLSQIHGIGEKIILSLKETFTNEENIQIMNELYQAGVRFDNLGQKKEKLPLEGVKFCITGSFQQKRDEIVENLEKYGAEFSSQVTKDLNFLLAGEKGGSKIEKAKKLGVNILSVDDLIKKYVFLKNDFGFRKNFPKQAGLF
ncbi:NAD-dependent DNA ligase LigA [Candidatus Absconditicoccus praedator]|uniref:NAD-dependent DNA ligase LigA n=1 Tax=Candidatus Absconditicoccus praedator TaxID=2735562 RepID=UPI001E296098|nr:NAD-dependent DNA ligase LigA [Candidatus Absconditicoccus praedator]UFX83317.1 NAD-dependent DNA ligase LigA [Candidatus Absconditicoccus praedator]